MRYFWLYLENRSTYKVCKASQNVQNGSSIHCTSRLHSFRDIKRNCSLLTFFNVFSENPDWLIYTLYHELNKQKFGWASIYCLRPVLPKVWVLCKATSENFPDLRGMIHIFEAWFTCFISILKNWQFLGLFTESWQTFHPESWNFPKKYKRVIVCNTINIISLHWQKEIYFTNYFQYTRAFACTTI